jgi:hypothetical protein
MGQAFGADFAGVRVHAGGPADGLNRALSARAFTIGNDIFLREGAYNPGTSGGRELLAHELTHVVQQGGNSAQVQGKLTLAAVREEGQVQVTVSDTGPGIPAEEREKVFEPLFTTKQTGTGLGLALSRRVVEAHGGRLTVESEIGKGSAFNIRLPLDAPAGVVAEGRDVSA